MLRKQRLLCQRFLLLHLQLLQFLLLLHVVSVASVLLPHAVSIAIVIAAVNKTANNFFITLLISAFLNANLVSKTTKIYHGRFGKSIVYAVFCYSYTYLKW